MIIGSAKSHHDLQLIQHTPITFFQMTLVISNDRIFKHIIPSSILTFPTRRLCFLASPHTPHLQQNNFGTMLRLCENFKTFWELQGKLETTWGHLLDKLGQPWDNFEFDTAWNNFEANLGQLLYDFETALEQLWEYFVTIGGGTSALFNYFVPPSLLINSSWLLKKRSPPPSPKNFTTA